MPIFGLFRRICTLLRRASTLQRFATIVAFAVMASSGSAFAVVWTPAKCPIWSYVWPDEFSAGKAILEAAFPSCKPARNVRCRLRVAQDFTRYICAGQLSSPCNMNDIFDGSVTTGSGLAVVGFPDGNTYCAFPTYDNADPGKNRGNPNPPCCGNPKANPVNIANGNKFQREVDFTPADEGGLEFIRFYNSVYPSFERFMGTAWTHSWTRSIEVYAGKAYAYRPDSKFYTFAPSGSQWVADADVPEQLEQLTGGGWKFTTREDEIEIYDAGGYLASVTSRSGKVTTLIYSDGTGTGPRGALIDGTTSPLVSGRLIRVVDFKGRSIQLYYGTNTNISRVVDPAGGTYRYGYDSSRRLATVEAPGGGIRTYHYGETAYTSGASLPNALTGITDETGSRFAIYKYLSDGRTLSSEHAGGVDKFTFTYGTGSVSYVDPIGTTRSSPISVILGVQQIGGTTQNCPGCGGTATQSYTFDASRNLSSERDFRGNLTCYSFAGRNLETQRTEGLSGSGTCESRVTTFATRTVSTEWHPEWRLPKRIADPLKITSFSYNGEPGVSCAPAGAASTLVCSKSVQATTDADGSAAFQATADGTPRIRSYTYNAAGQVLTADGPRGDVTDVTTYAYYTSDDPSGNFHAGDLASITNAKNQATQIVAYDAAGRVIKTIDPNGLETLLEYWPRGWIKSRKLGTQAAGYETTAYEYDALGQLRKVIMPDASFVSYTYDAAHRLTDIADGLGNRIHYTLDNIGNRVGEAAYDPGNVLARSHSRVIDALNRVFKDIGGTDPTTQVTQNGFDANGNVTSILDALGRTTTQEFDALNRLAAVKDPFNGPSAPTSYQYNGQAMLTQVTDPTGLATSYTVNGHGEMLLLASPDTGATAFTYDPASNVLAKVDARNVQATYSYDELNRLVQVIYPDETVTYLYDTCAHGVGRLCSIIDRSGTTSYGYDLWGRVTSKSQTVGTLTQTMSYSYNAYGQLASIGTPSGRQVVYGYANYRPVSVTVDGVNVLNSVVYEPFGPNGGWTWGNSTPAAPNTHTRLLDKDFRVARVTSDLPVTGIQPHFDRQFSWDAQSRVQSITDLANSALSATYGYDALDRLASAAQGAASWGYTYNGIGDRLTSTVGAASTTYGYASGTHRLAGLSGAQAKSYAYDAAGNMTSDGTTTWTYGGNNRPTAAGTLAFLINALGQRVKKSGAGSATRFVYDEAGRLWGEYTEAGALIQETVWLEDLPIATLRPNGSGADVYYVHPDHLGTPRAVTRATDNQFVWKWDTTEPFGHSAPDENPAGLGSFAFNLRFPGQYFDAETGKHYNYYRDYDPAIGRYIQSDPIGLEGGLNAYAYVDASPLSLVDEKGLAKTEYIYSKCSDTQMLRCVEKCRAEGRVYRECTQLYIKIPGVNNGRPRFVSDTCLCKDRDPPPFSCGEPCQKTLATIGAVILMVCLRLPVPIP